MRYWCGFTNGKPDLEICVEDRAVTCTGTPYGKLYKTKALAQQFYSDVRRVTVEFHPKVNK